MTAAAQMIEASVERLLAAVLLFLASPILLVISLLIVLDSGLPILFFQERMGQHGKPFRIVKFRSMRRSSHGPAITSAGDLRITRAGDFLRTYKLDELPQLWNIIAGQMRFIGPRPEVPSYVELSSALWKELLESKPGLTDPSSLAYRNEEQMLSRYENAHTAYRDEILPRKLRLSIRYLRRRSIFSDCRVLLWTVRYSFFPWTIDAARFTKDILKG